MALPIADFSMIDLEEVRRVFPDCEDLVEALKSGDIWAMQLFHEHEAPIRVLWKQIANQVQIAIGGEPLIDP